MQVEVRKLGLVAKSRPKSPLSAHRFFQLVSPSASAKSPITVWRRFICRLAGGHEPNPESSALQPLDDCMVARGLKEV